MQNFNLLDYNWRFVIYACIFGAEQHVKERETQIRRLQSSTERSQFLGKRRFSESKTVYFREPITEPFVASRRFKLACGCLWAAGSHWFDTSAYSITKILYLLLINLFECMQGLKLQECVNEINETNCLENTPAIVFGGRGSTADIYLENAAYGEFLANRLNATFVDTSSAAVALVREKGKERKACSWF